jgi:hydrogenase maturation protease
MDKALIIGYGNPLRSDDGFGWHASRLIARELAGRNAEVITCHQLTPELAEPLSRCSRAVFIDADTEGDPGDIRCRDVQPQAPSSSALTHSCSPAGLLASAATLYGHCPQAVVITVSAQSFGFGDSLSPVVSAALPKVVDRVLQFACLNASRLLIVGCGNPDAGDDSAGPEIVRRLSELGDCGCDLRAETTPGVELLDTFALADVILFVDAVTSGGVPGTLYLTSLPSKELEPRALGSLSSHGWGLAEALKLANALGRAVPRLFLLGIEVGTVAQGAPRSAAVEQAVALAVERISDLRSLLLNSQVIATRSFNPNDRSFPGFRIEDSGFRFPPHSDSES